LDLGGDPIAGSALDRTCIELLEVWNPRLTSLGHSTDARPDLPPVVIGVAVATGGLPVRPRLRPGNTTDATVLAEVKQDLAGWQLNGTVWIADAGFASTANCKVLSQVGSGFIAAERLRGSAADVVQARSRAGPHRR